jgi:hypothetical protein
MYDKNEPEAEEVYRVTDRRWWRCSKDDDSRSELASAVWSAFDVARSHDTGRRSMYARMRAIYETGLVADDGDWLNSDATTSHASRDNITASIVDTAAAKLLEARPAPLCLTSGGDMQLRRQAELLTEWAAAAVEEIGTYQTVETAWTDAMICGSSAVRVYERDGEPAIETAFCDDIYVDPLEAYNEAVMTYYQVRVMDRAVLAGKFPDHEPAIMAASSSAADDITAEQVAVSENGSTADLVTVVLAWRVAPSRRAKEDPGRHVVVLHGAQAGDLVLQDVDYPDHRPPFVFLHYRTVPRKFWGIGLVATLAPIQAEVDELGSVVDETLATFVPQVWIREGSVKAKEVSDELGCVYTYSGEPPVFFDPSGTAAVGQRQWQETRMQRGYHLAGVSSTEAGAMKEAGLDSGKALRVHQDIKSQRLVMQHRELEDAYRDIFRRVIDVADQIVVGEDASGDTSSKTTKADRMTYLAGAGDELQEMSFSDVRIRDAMYKIDIFPVSKLSDSPAGRQAEVMDLMNAGLLQGDEAIDILDFPDLKRMTSLRNASQRWAKTLCEKASYGEVGPDVVTSLDDHGTIISYGTLLHARSMVEGSDIDDLEALRQVIARAVDFQTKAQAAMQPPAPPPGMPPGPPPMAPPVGAM